MRSSGMFLAGAALALGGCGPKGADGNAAADAGMTAEAITANDVTAIDAVTGHAANMAADVDYSNVATGNSADRSAGAPGDKAAARPGPARPQPSAAPDGSTDPIRDSGDEAAAPANAQ